MSYRKLTDSDIKTEIRNFKLKIISGEFQVSEFSDVNIKKHTSDLNFISNNLSKNDIITGSLALKLYGLLDRKIGDIDIIIDDPNRYQGYVSSGYREMNIDNRLGYKNFTEGSRWLFNRKEYKIDFFKNDDVNFTEMYFNGEKLKLHNLIDIINHKSNMVLSRNVYRYENKHYYDLVHIFDVINSVY